MKKLNFCDGTIAQAWCSKENEHKIMDVDLAMECGRIAQRLFDSWFKENIENAPTVYSDDKGGVWFDDACKENSDTRKAKLVMIEEIK